MLPAPLVGGSTACWPGSSVATPIVPQNGAIGIWMSWRSSAVLRSPRSKYRTYGSGKSEARSPGPGLELQDFDLEGVAGLRTLHVDGASQRVEAVEVQGTELRGRVPLLQLSGRHLLSVEVDDVARLDLDRRWNRVVPLEMEGVAADRVLSLSGSCHHRFTSCAVPSFSGTALARSTFLSNLPTEVLGTSSMNRTSSGSHHLATLSLRKSITSSWVTWPLNSGLGTAYAMGRSSHFGCARPMTAASMILGCDMIAFSSSTDEIHSPPDLMTSLVRSTISM